MSSIRQQIRVMAPMRDGVRLACDIRLPAGDGPFPAVLRRTPYNKAIPITDPVMRGFIGAGFAHVVQDGRGTHESEGTYTPWRQDIDDGYDTVAWVASQPWCDGRVVMSGASYCGWTQLAALSTAPPALKAIAPAMIGSDGYLDMIYPGGAPSTGLLWWCINNDGPSQRSELSDNWLRIFSTLPIRRMDEAVGCPSPIMQSWLDHPTRDAFWTGVDLTAGGAATAGALLIGGWFDPFVGGILRAYNRLAVHRRTTDGGPIRLLVGPWPHSTDAPPALGDMDFGPSSRVDLIAEQLAFYRTCLDGGDPSTPPVRVFMMGANEWRHEDAWPPARMAPTPWYLGCRRAANSLHGDGTLTPAPTAGRPADHYTYDPMAPAPTLGGATLLPEDPAGPVDRRPVERRDDVLCYTSAPLEAPLEITGDVALELYISSSAPDTDFIGHLCDVEPNGRSLVLCDGILRARYREGFDKAVPLAADEIVKLSFPIGVTAHRFRPGHRIRLEVASSCFPKYARNLNTGGDIADECDPVVVEQSVHHSAAYPSRVLLPVV
ncbi:MAG: CocE/NonD family hydrolase [Planctomycetota bacterium]